MSASHNLRLDSVAKILKALDQLWFSQTSISLINWKLPFFLRFPSVCRVVRESSDSGVELEQAAESVATANVLPFGDTSGGGKRRRLPLPEILSRLKRGERVDHFETVRQRKNGTLIEISLTISPVRGARGVVVGASKIARGRNEVLYSRR